jgi:hypothetical protein
MLTAPLQVLTIPLFQTERPFASTNPTTTQYPYGHKKLSFPLSHFFSSALLSNTSNPSPVSASPLPRTPLPLFHLKNTASSLDLSPKKKKKKNLTFTFSALFNTQLQSHFLHSSPKSPSSSTQKKNKKKLVAYRWFHWRTISASHR